ncbi:type II toxin-antitoxin system VapC family toxin [Microbacterium sp.]|uniref:type II toxin-antitoxin system VapC family toxin n=1 Tax=Microbacterium sp. TaxID=51671 RepID=UPI003A841832
MVDAYLDTSAAMKLIVAEHGSSEIVSVLDDPQRRVVASWLLHTELQCAAGRRPDDISHPRMRAVLERILLVDLVRADLLTAGTLTPSRSQDAIHLAVALRLGVQEMITYDRELADAAEHAGLRVISPGAPQ